MAAFNLNKAVMTVTIALAAQTLAQIALAKDLQQPLPAPAPTSRVIVVSLEDHKLALVEDGQIKKVYTVAVGKPTTPSPEGTFTIERRVKNPVYQHEGKTIQPGTSNPVGTRWMGLSKHGYGIHGTNEPKSIGKAASHGCIRMAKADLEEFYELVAEGDTVQIIGQRNQQTAQLFGATEKTDTPARPLLTAAVSPANEILQGPLTVANSAHNSVAEVSMLTALIGSR